MIDMRILREIVAEQYAVMVEQEHGGSGVIALRGLLQSLDAIYQSVSPETLANPLVVLKALDDSTRVLPTDEAIAVTHPRHLSEHLHGTAIIQVLDNRQLLLWKRTSPAIEKLAQTAVVYVYDNRLERMYANKSSRILKNPVPTYPSCFAIPTFSELNFALEEYSVKMVQHCTSYILAEVWRTQNRMVVPLVKTVKGPLLRWITSPCYA